MRTYYVNNYIVKASGFSMTDQLNTRTVCDITVTDLLTLTGLYWHYAENQWQVEETEWAETPDLPGDIFIGDTITVAEDSVVIFTGLIKNIQKVERYPGVLEYRINAVDNSAIADKRLVAKVYNNTLAGDIVKDILSEILSQEGVTEGTIQDGALITKAVFNYITVSDAFEYLETLTGFNWEIDFGKKLNFYARETNISTITVDDSLQHYNFSETKNMDQYRNVQYTRGGRGETSTQTLETPAPKPDGQTRTFTLRFPLASKPEIYIDSVQVDPNLIGVNGKDTGKEWYYTINSPNISQDRSLTALSTEVLEVTYKGYRDLFGRSEDPDKIIDRQSKETGTSGIYEKLTEERSINTIEQLKAFNASLVEKYGDVNNKVRFTTHQTGFRSGQLVRINKPLYGIDEYMLIDNVKAYNYGEKVEYQISALDGASFGGWEKFFKDLYNQSKTFVIAENELLIIVNTFKETRLRYGETNIGVFAPPKVSDTLIIPFLVGGPALSEVKLVD